MPDRRPVTPEHFCQLVDVNVGNEKLSDEDFRKFIENTLPIVDFERVEKSGAYVDFHPEEKRDA